MCLLSFFLATIFHCLHYPSWQLLTQICLALSALVLRAAEYRQPIEQLFYSLQSFQTQENGNIAVIEMLTVLPEEVVEDQSTDSSINFAQRSQYTREVSPQPELAYPLLLRSFCPASYELLKCSFYHILLWFLSS